MNIYQEYMDNLAESILADRKRYTALWGVKENEWLRVRIGHNLEPNFEKMLSKAGVKFKKLMPHLYQILDAPENVTLDTSVLKES